MQRDHIDVLIVYAASANTVWQKRMVLPSGTEVGGAIQASGFMHEFANVDWQANGVGIFGKRVDAEHSLADGDRIEIYRALTFDPKESRRRRAVHKLRQTHRPPRRRRWNGR